MRLLSTKGKKVAVKKEKNPPHPPPIQSKAVLANLPETTVSKLTKKTKNALLLHKLPLNITNDKLKASINDISGLKRAEVEPGCAIHFTNEADASYWQKNLQYKSNLRQTSLPSVLVQGIPSDVSAKNVNEVITKYNVKSILSKGLPNIEINVKEAKDVLAVRKLLESLPNLKEASQFITKLADGTFALQVFNLAASEDISSLANEVQSKVREISPESIVKASSTAHSSYKLRIKNSKYDLNHFRRQLKDIQFKNVKPSSIKVEELKKPCLLLHGGGKIGVDKLRTILIDDNKAERVQLNYTTKDITSDVAIAFFKSESDALQALEKIKGLKVDDVKLNGTYRELAEPAIKISGLGPDMSTFQINETIAEATPTKPIRIEILESNSTDTVAHVVFSSPKEVTKVMQALKEKSSLKVKAVELCDIGVTMNFPQNKIPSVEEIIEKTSRLNFAVKIVILNTNISLDFGFETLEEAEKFKDDISSGKCVFSGQQIIEGRLEAFEFQQADLSTLPSFTLEVTGILPTTSAQDVLSAGGDLGKYLSADRSAFIKFTTHKDTAAAQEILQQVQIEGKPVVVRKYSPLHRQGNSEFDEIGEVERFDERTLSELHGHNDQNDAGERYQYVKNRFDIAVHDALLDEVDVARFFEGVEADIDSDLDENADDTELIAGQTEESSASNSEDEDEVSPTPRQQSRVMPPLSNGITSAMYSEARQLLEKRKQLDAILERDEEELPSNDPVVIQHKEVTNRLFELYIKRDDMKKFAHDFEDLSNTLGKPDDTDPLSWGAFPSVYDDEMTDANQKMYDMMPQLPKKKKEEDNKAEKEEEQEDHYDSKVLMDSNGCLWSGLIINEDMTQKTTPAGRVMSHRCLVVIGNMRGSAGYGMGKGESINIALDCAFRDALNNLIHLDLYENGGLCHDVTAKYNNCYAYIKATPKQREMVADEKVKEILNLFGISSASVKIIGRRDPYAMVKSIFKALQHHRNLDDIAKSRGARYMTLKWARDNL